MEKIDYSKVDVDELVESLGTSLKVMMYAKLELDFKNFKKLMTKVVNEIDDASLQTFLDSGKKLEKKLDDDIKEMDMIINHYVRDEKNKTIIRSVMKHEYGLFAFKWAKETAKFYKIPIIKMMVDKALN